MEKLHNILVYEWNSWRGYLISHLVERHCAAQWDDDWAVLDAACRPGTEAVLFHHCLSHAALFPRRRAAFEDRLAQQGTKLLNAGLADMRKRTLHAMLERAGLRCARAARRGPGDQNLFVKTDLNYGGKAERTLPSDLHPVFSFDADCPIRGWNDYRLVRRDDIEPGWWNDPHLVIENYIGHDETLYRVLGCGNALIFILAHSKDLIKKENEHPDDQWVHVDRKRMAAGDTGLPRDLQQQVAAFIAAYPFDFFCLDVVHDGIEHTIVDLNLTPFHGTQAPRADWAALLRRGLHDLVVARP